MSERSAEAHIDGQLARRREAVAAAWGDARGVVLIGAGTPVGRPGRDDLTYPFEAHSEYLYLTDRDAPGGVLAFHPDDGWVDFTAPITVEDRLWSGAPAEDPPGPTTAELEDWLSGRSGAPVVWLGSPPAGVSRDPERAQELRYGLAAVRRRKDPVELARMRRATEATAAAFAAAVPLLRAGVSEREVQIELEAEAFRHGAASMAYDTIVGGGPNAAVLHFMPTDRRFREGELVLIDAGAQYRGYASDITRTYPVNGSFAGLQQELHAVVHRAERTAIEHCRPGVEWREIHRLAGLAIAEGLVDVGVLRGDPAELVESGAVWLFFPHGVGHLVGLGVRDAGGTPLRERRDVPRPYPNLRIDLPLEPGMVVTVEPGLYFVPAILRDRTHRDRHAETVDWSMVDGLLGFGGIRIEDDVLITDDGAEILTAAVPLLG
ncbi:MAG TPA: aminopeptidase P family protein [Solirubrobacteraceae bacterium]|nr:aminopeptidase P family protein [Solirubrobacteraceae bacterium]